MKASGSELLKDPQVIKEIEKYKWVESEKAHADIGFERASNEWMSKFSKEWVKNHPVKEKKPTRSAKSMK